MFVSIVVGTDGSDTAAEAVRQAIDLAKLSGAQLSIVSAYPARVFALPTQRSSEEKQHAPSNLQPEVPAREDVTRVLDEAATAAKDEGVEVQTYPVEGNPAAAILDIAEESGADLIVVGNRGMTAVRRFFVSTVPNNISHHAPCSVLIVQTT